MFLTIIERFIKKDADCEVVQVEPYGLYETYSITEMNQVKTLTAKLVGKSVIFPAALPHPTYPGCKSQMGAYGFYRQCYDSDTDRTSFKYTVYIL